MDDAVASELPLYPDIRDPRVMVAVPRDRRAALAALWALAERLTRLLLDAREPLIGQIKLAWWRDMMVMLASEPAALPKGEPLLAELQATWAGQGSLDTLVDAAEAVLLVEDDSEARRVAAAGFGKTLFALSGGGDGVRWGMIWGAGMQADTDEAQALFTAARAVPAPSRGDFGGAKALLMLDRWAGAIAREDGVRNLRREGLLLFRVGLFGR